MKGHTHALTGAAVGAAAGMFGPHLSPGKTLMLAGFTAGFATLPDLDQVGSCAARSLGFASKAFAWVVHLVSGGHRHGTHSVVGAAVFTVLAIAAAAFRSYPAGRWGLAVLLAVAFGGGLRALRLGGHFADVLAIAAAVGVAWSGWGLTFVPFACFAGFLAHIGGDMCTKEGCPVMWPFTLDHWFALPRRLRFTTGHTAERVAVTPLLWITLAWLAWHALTVAVPAIHL